MKKSDAKKRIDVYVDVDTTKLYGSIDVAIQYLQEVKNTYGPEVSLEEYWSGGEDMEMRLVYNREETDDEYTARLAREKFEKEQREKTLRLDKEREADIVEYKRLKDKLRLT